MDELLQSVNAVRVLSNKLNTEFLMLSRPACVAAGKRTNTGLSLPQLAVLAAVADTDHASQVYLSRVAGVNDAVMTNMVHKLRRDGLVDVRVDVKDGRRNVVTLTAAGLGALNSYLGMLEDMERRVVVLPLREKLRMYDLVERAVLHIL